MKRDEMRNLVLSVVFTAIVCVAVMAGGIAMSIAPSRSMPTMSLDGVGSVPPEAPSPTDDREHINANVDAAAVGSVFFSAYRQPRTEQDRDWRTQQRVEMMQEDFERSFLQERATIIDDTASIRRLGYWIEFEALRLPAEIMKSPWMQRISLHDPLAPNLRFTKMRISTAVPIEEQELQVQMISGYGSLGSGDTVELVPCVENTPLDIQAAATIFAMNYTESFSELSGDNPCQYVKKSATLDDADVLSGSVGEGGVGLYRLTIERPWAPVDGWRAGLTRQDAPALLFRPDHGTANIEAVKRRIGAGMYKLIEVSLWAKDRPENPVLATELDALVEKLYEKIGDSSIAVSVCYDDCF